jgi:sulfoxide reductase heme-binding subunit YedZ
VTARLRISLKVLVWAACLSPILYLVRGWLIDELTADPINYLTRRLGLTALILLLSSLSMTPIRILFGAAWPIHFRRLLGLFAFFYVCLHFSMWVLVDHFFNWGQMLEDIVKRPYITVGMTALTLLVPLAATSTKGMIKRLGGARWRLLHKLAYVVAGLAVLHFLWLAKAGVRDPYVYAGVLALLLGIRLWEWSRRRVARLRPALAVEPVTPPLGKSERVGGASAPPMLDRSKR